MAANRIVYFYVVLLSFALFVLSDLYLFHLFFIFILLLPVISLLSALPVSRALRYSMEVEDDILPKGECYVSLTGKNAVLLPCACVRIRLGRRNALGRMDGRYTESSEETVRLSLAPGRAFSHRLPVDMAYCGRVDLSIQRVDVCDMLGLFFLPVPKANGRAVSSSVYVLPELQSRTIQTDDAADLGLDSATYSTKKPGNDPSEIFQLRDYREGDARHSIHWKLSARMDRLIVREFGLPLNPSLHFLLELRADAEPAAAEYLLGTVLAFSEYLMARSAVHSISWVGEEGMLHTISVSGPDTLAAALHELLALPGQKNWSTLEKFALQSAQSETHLVYMVAGSIWKSGEDESAKRLLESIIGLGVCRRLTLMPERCSPQAAKALRSLGCEVQLLNGSIPDMMTEVEE